MQFFTPRFSFALVAAAFLPFLASAQTVTYSEQIAPILYAKCSSCHHEGAIAPFTLMSYADAEDNKWDIMAEVNDGTMPPWPPDPTYSHFAKERLLTENEKALITEWVTNGAPEGDPALAPAPPVFNEGSELGTVDLTKQIPTYSVQSSEDEYRCFAIPSGLTEDKFVHSLEIIPGNRSIVHHVIIFYDTTGQCINNDIADPQPGYLCGGGGTNCGLTRMVGSWVPGSGFTEYPPNMGVPLEANGTFVMQVHYAPGSNGQTDSTRMNIQFTTEPFVRPVYISAPLEHTYTLTNGPLHIPPHSTASFHSQYQVTPVDFSVLAVAPHMHLRGKSIEAFGVTPAADTLKFIRIPHWDFHWQGAYMFPKLMKLPNGTMLHANADYDNTSANEHNHHPEADVWLGEGTEDEMMLVYFAFTYYLPGDEDIILDSASVFTSLAAATQEGIYFNASPNPASGETVVYLNAETATKATLRLYDAQGRLVKEYWNGRTLRNEWLTERVALDNISAGMYFLSLESNGRKSIRKLSVY